MVWVVDIDDERTHTYYESTYMHDSHKQSSQVTRNRQQTTHTKVCDAVAAPRGWVLDRCGNDPSAGSPTDTLLRLHLPLNGKV